MENSRFPNFSRREGLLIAIIQDADTNAVLMHGFMDSIALYRTLKTGVVHLWSTSRNRPWQKGEESGNVMRWVKWSHDCDGDAILLRVHIEGDGLACHEKRFSCFVDFDPATLEW